MAISVQNVNRNPRDLSSDRTANVMLYGIVAGIVISILMAIARSMGLTNLNIERGFGSLLLAQVGAGSWILGLVIHLAFSMLFALVYAAGFRKVGAAGWSIGSAFGVAHWALIGVFAGFLPWIHPLMPNVIAPPGFFGVNTGLFGFFFLLLVHVIYGAIVGDGYARLVHGHTAQTHTGALSH